MQIPIDRELPPKERGFQVARIDPGVTLSLESQLKLRALYGYIDSCRLTLSGIERELSFHGSNQGGSANVKRAAEGLGKFCVEADSWGFNALYEIAFGLQMLLLNKGGRIQSDNFRKTLERGLAMLSALLEQCENDFFWRLAVADMLDCLDQAGRN
jgi:hypothetical protein